MTINEDYGHSTVPTMLLKKKKKKMLLGTLKLLKTFKKGKT